MSYIRFRGLLLFVLLLGQPVLASPVRRIPVLYKEGMACKQAGQLLSARRHFAAILRKDKGYTAAWLQLGMIYHLMNEPTLAVIHLKEALKREPTLTAGLKELAHLYYEEENYPQAIVYWERLLTLTPSDDYVRFMLGKAYIGEGEREKGERLCDEATKLL